MGIDELRRQHQELTRLARQLLEAVEDCATQQGIGTVRWQLARQLMAHLALEDRIFYPAMQRLPDERARMTARRLEGEMGMLAQNFSAYMQRWDDDHIARHWAEFCHETRELLGLLKKRIEQEEQLLYPLAETSARPAGTTSPTAERSG